MTEIIEDNIIENMSNIFKHLCEYDYIYISIGSKINENIVSKRGKIYMSNAFEQIYPGFLQYNETHKILLIAIDDFRNREKQRTHKIKIDSILTPNIKCYILNQICTDKFITSFFSYIFDELTILNFKAENIMIANFIRFLHIPNKKEETDEIMIPEMIQSLLNKDIYTPYEHCLYQWFGYKHYFYNFIYRYKKFKQNPMVYNKIHFVEEILKKTKNKPCSSNFVLQDETIAYMLNNMYSISDPNVVSLDLVVSVYKDYSAMGIIIPI
jgi:hypothetical protein